MRHFVWLVLGLLLPAAGLSGGELFKKEPKGPKVGVELLADRAAGVPGGSVELAVQFKLEDGWHIYWRNRGEGGLEPTFEWKLPVGFKVGALRYPMPTRYVDQADAHTFILEGEPAILTQLSIPKDAAVGTDALLSVDVGWLICKEICIPGERKVALSLPIVAKDEEAKPTNELAFKVARAALPLEGSKARYLKSLSARPSVEKIAPGSKFEVLVEVEVAEGHHINSNKPLAQFLIPTDLFHDHTEGLQIDRPVFPEGKIEEEPRLKQKLSIYRGKTVVRLPIEAYMDLMGDEVLVSGIVTYQACNDKSGQCYPRTAAEWAVTIPVDASAKPVEPEAGKDQPAEKHSVLPTGDTPTAGPREDASGAAAPQSGTFLGRLQLALGRWGVMGHLLMAFVGGFVLNFMPCVLPVISIKVLSFVQQAKEHRWRVFTLGLAFAMGILWSFMVIGVSIVALGQQWGGLFQRPQVVIGLAGLVTAFALSLFGVFSLFPPRFVNELGQKVKEKGHLSAFGTGLLATVLGTACTAPFLSAAVAVASQQTPVIGILIFLAAGLGMALPYVVLAAHPAWIALVPRPGPWTTTFEHVVGFCLLGTVVWLVRPIATALGGEGLLLTLLFLIFVSVAAWLYGKVQFGDPAPRRLRYYGSAGAFVVGGWMICFHYANTIDGLILNEKARRLGTAAAACGDLDWSKPDIPWQEYTRDRALETVKTGCTIFVDYTAEWCVNCKANEKFVINTREVRETMRELGVMPFRADFTLPDPEIKEDLERFGRAGVPMYVIYPAKRPDRPILLDELLTPSSIIDNLKKAGPSVSMSGLSMGG